MQARQIFRNDRAGVSRRLFVADSEIALMVRFPVSERDRLVADASGTYYVTEHYLKHPALLVRLARIDRAELDDLLHKAWYFLAERSAR